MLIIFETFKKVFKNEGVNVDKEVTMPVWRGNN